MLDLLAIGSAHIPATSNVRSGLTRHRSALCIVVGASLGSACHCHWPVLVVTGGPIRRRSAVCVIIGPSSSSLGYHLARTCRWWAYWLTLGRGQGLLIVVGTPPGPFSLGLVVAGLSYSSSVVGSSFPRAGITRVTMVGVGCSCLIRYASVGQNVSVEHMWSGKEEREK